MGQGLLLGWVLGGAGDQRVVAVLYLVFGPFFLYLLGNRRPFLALRFDQGQQLTILLLPPRLLLHPSIQMIIPPLPTMFRTLKHPTDPPKKQLLRNLIPLPLLKIPSIKNKLLIKLSQQIIFLLGPGYSARSPLDVRVLVF